MPTVSSVIVNNIRLPIDASFKEAFSVARDRLSELNISCSLENCKIYKKSVDAREKNNITFVYSVCVTGLSHLPNEKRLSQHGIASYSEAKPQAVIGEEKLFERPVVVGTGPCGLFAALLLAENGYMPLVLERGGSITERKRAVDALNKFGILDEDTNIQFGAGGAGTFSDGKLVTRINDPFSSYVLDRLIEFGAPEEIRYAAKPHIGTDILTGIVEKILDRIASLGAQIMYHTKFLGLISEGGRVKGIRTSKGEMPAGAVILAVGHSARDTYLSLMNDGTELLAKPFSVGMRIEHLTEDIDKAMYGSFAGHEALGHAEYALSYNTKVRGVYTFCMCPGGVVVPAASEAGGVVVNGMSEHKRDGRNSNSAVVCSIFREDYGATPLGAIEFQRKIERAAFKHGGGNYTAPMITVGDFLNDKKEKEPGRVMPSYRNGQVRLASPYDYLPGFVCDNIKNALLSFDKKISGFGAADAVLTGAETRTSSPVRILRDNETGLAAGYGNFYPAGEGAGYAGGITSAAIDGMRAALKLIKKYKPFR